MSSTAAARGFVFFLLSVQVIQSEDGWGVTYTPLEVCGERESTVEIDCNYTYPSRIQHEDLSYRYWFIKEKNGEPLDLMADSEYLGRVKYKCSEKRCILIIKNVRESDSAEYRFRFMTDDPKDKYTGFPGVTMTVTDPGVHVEVTRFPYNRVDLKCLSSCVLGDKPVHMWYKNGRHIKTGSTSYTVLFGSADVYACAVRGFEKQRSTPVYAPRLPFVAVRPNTDIVEGRSANLYCRSNANPAAEYVWFKENRKTNLGKSLQLPFTSIKSSDSGKFYCAAENEMGMRRSESVTIDVKYAPHRPSVSAMPSAKAVEGSSVTLTCSCDANPAANYTWYKEDNASSKASGRIFTIADFRAKHIGKYYCEAWNNRGSCNATLYMAVAIPDRKAVYIILTLVGVVPLALIPMFLWMRKKNIALCRKTKPDEPDEPVDGVELHRMSVYDDAVPTVDTKEQEDWM